MNEKIRDAMMMAAIDCGHTITDDAITLHRRCTAPGNALAQLSDRLVAACPTVDKASFQQHAQAAQPKCKTCGGQGVVDDGEIDCYPNGEPFVCGPVKCVKDCPDCGAAGNAQAALSDEQIVAVWQSMPGGPEGWLKSFGFLQFARAILATRQPARATGDVARGDVTASFETWAKAKGLIRESHGIRSESSMSGLALEAWEAAFATRHISPLTAAVTQGDALSPQSAPTTQQERAWYKDWLAGLDGNITLDQIEFGRRVWAERARRAAEGGAG